MISSYTARCQNSLCSQYEIACFYHEYNPSRHIYTACIRRNGSCFGSLYLAQDSVSAGFMERGGPTSCNADVANANIFSAAAREGATKIIVMSGLLNARRAMPSDNNPEMRNPMGIWSHSEPTIVAVAASETSGVIAYNLHILRFFSWQIA